jgi:hypothetical protein
MTELSKMRSEVSAIYPCPGRFIQNWLDMALSALITEMPFLGIGLAGHHGQLLLLGLMLAAEIADIDCRHVKRPFSSMRVVVCQGLGSSGTASVGSEASSQFVRRGAR